ncbi:cyclin-dependent kinase [Trifolium repens]|nr:cyclin-dependent kinase [Trifolium repens]
METKKTVVHLGRPFLRPDQWDVLTPLYKDFDLIRSEGPRYGEMFKCKLKSTKEVVAVKILTIPEDHKSNGIPYSILNHVSILKALKHENIVKLETVIRTDEDVEDVYLVFKHIDTSLKKFLATPFPFDIKKLGKPLLRQALSGLAYIHIQKIIHRDLKPHNILVSFKNQEINEVKLTDFGVAKSIAPPLSPYSIHMGNPCYKAPELLLGFTNYSTAVDIWSMGCIFAEMIKRQPLFVGKDGPKILTEIFWLLGTPTEETWPGVSSICTFIKAFDPPIKPKDLAAEFPMLEPDGLDLLSKMLCLCPNRRISADEALDHPYLRPSAP